MFWDNKIQKLETAFKNICEQYEKLIGEYNHLLIFCNALVEQLKLMEKMKEDKSNYKQIVLGSNKDLAGTKWENFNHNWKVFLQEIKYNFISGN
jgi:archaellum component FlaC